MNISEGTQLLQFTVSPDTVYVSTNPGHSSYTNLTVTVTNISGSTLSVNNFAITLPPTLFGAGSLSSIKPVTNAPTIWSFQPSQINLGEFDAVSQSGNSVSMQAAATWEFQLQMVTLNNTNTLPCAQNIKAQVTYGDGSIFPQQLSITMEASKQSIVFYSEPASIIPGGSAVLTWQCDGMDYCLMDPGDGSKLSYSGSKEISPPETTIYTLYAYASGVILSAQWAISVNVPKIIEFSGRDGETVDLGDNITLVWKCNQYTQRITLANNTGIVIPPLLTNGNTIASGSVNVGPVKEATTFTFTAYGTAANDIDYRDALISINNVTGTLTANPDRGSWEGNNVTLTWDIKSASAVSLTPDVDNGPSITNLSGSVVINPLQDVDYLMTISGVVNNAPGTIQIPLSLKVNTLAINYFEADPSTVLTSYGNQTTLKWDVVGEVVAIDNGLGEQPPTGQINIDKPADGAMYTILVGTKLYPILVSKTVYINNGYGPFVVNALLNVGTAPMVQFVIPQPGGMANLDGDLLNYDVTLTGITLVGYDQSTNLSARAFYNKDNPKQSYFSVWIAMQPQINPVFQWADRYNPTGTITLNYGYQ